MPVRPPRTHIFIIDGTLSRLAEGHETNAGLLYKMLLEVGPRLEQTVGYHPGVQGEGLRKWLNVAAGIGINQAIRAGYAALCSRYEPGDRLMIYGFSRGAYAARSLAGFIGRIGLLQSEHATERRILNAFRYYEAIETSNGARHFSARFCRMDVPIEVIGVWDTVRTLGLPYPVLTRLAPLATAFHNDELDANTRFAFQALALDETRQAFTPMPWCVPKDWKGHLEQMWFAGAHADIGGHVGARPAYRRLSNIPLVWMLEKSAQCGVILPENWRERFPTDPSAPMLGDRHGTAKLFLLRARRLAGTCPAEALHPSVAERTAAVHRYRPKARWVRVPDEPETGP